MMKLRFKKQNERGFYIIRLPIPKDSGKGYRQGELFLSVGKWGFHNNLDDIYGWSADELHQIADKLDELNKVKVEKTDMCENCGDFSPYGSYCSKKCEKEDEKRIQKAIEEEGMRRQG